MFDSTHFSHGSTVEVEITITTDAGVFTHSYQSNAFNQIRAWSANYTPPGWFNSAGLVDQLIGSTEIPVLDTYGGNWSKDDFLNTMDEASVLYICSHGYTDSLTAQNWDLISWAEMESVRAAQMGQGNHPYNSTGVPAINFFHIDTCKAGANNNFIRACYPYINAYGNLLQDQAILGYVPSVSISSIQTMTQAIWGALSTGETVNEAKEALCQSGVQVTDTGEFYRPIRENDVAIYGDIYTRVTGLYTGNDYHASSWFKVY